MAEYEATSGVMGCGAPADARLKKALRLERR
jgi:hypothetical protein